MPLIQRPSSHVDLQCNFKAQKKRSPLRSKFARGDAKTEQAAHESRTPHPHIDWSSRKERGEGYICSDCPSLHVAGDRSLPSGSSTSDNCGVFVSFMFASNRTEPAALGLRLPCGPEDKWRCAGTGKVLLESWSLSLCRMFCDDKVVESGTAFHVIIVMKYFVHSVTVMLIHVLSPIVSGFFQCRQNAV